MNELSEEDRQRIEQQSKLIYQEDFRGGFDLTTSHQFAFRLGAEYATRYEREQQETLKNQVEYWRNCKVCSDEIGEAVIKKLEAERTELIGKLQARLERCRKVSGYSSGFSDIHNEIDFLDLLLNSLKNQIS